MARRITCLAGFLALVLVSATIAAGDDVYCEFTSSSISCENQHGTEFAYIQWTTNTYGCAQTQPYIMIYRRFTTSSEWEYLDISYNYAGGQYVDSCPIGSGVARHLYYKLVLWCPSCEYASDEALLDTRTCCTP